MAAHGARAETTRAQAMSFPVSIKGVLLDGDRVALLENERSEWELPGGRLQTDEPPVVCLMREFAEELGIEVAADHILDCWVYEISAAAAGRYCDLRGASAG